MEISKSVKISEIEQKAMKELADSFQTIVDAMNPRDSIETGKQFWDYEQVAVIVALLSDLAENDIVFIR